MNTKILLTASAIFLGVIGIVFSFLPQELLIYFNTGSNPILITFLQLLGALYIGFAITNWMVKGSLMGGIYNRPIAMGNFVHFFIGAITLLKIVFVMQTSILIISALTAIYSILAVCYGFVFLRNPSKVEK